MACKTNVVQRRRCGSYNNWDIDRRPQMATAHDSQTPVPKDTAGTARAKKRAPLPDKVRRNVQGVGAIAGVTLALAGTAVATSTGPPGGSTTTARVASAPQNYPSASP